MRRALRALALAALVVCLPFALQAATGPDELLTNSGQEARARELTRQLRCVVCPNQSIDDSDADIARDLRRIVRERVADGQGNEQILDFLTERYGEYVLLRPPVRPATWGLWFGPLAVLLVALAGLIAARLFGRRRAPVSELSPEERARLEKLLARPAERAR